MQIKKISKYKNTLGEGVWWDNKNKLLHWTDIIEGKLFTYNPETKIEGFKKFNGKLGCFSPCKNGHFLIGLDLSFYIYDPISKGMKKFLDLKDEPSKNRINDGTTDPYGRFWVGTMTSEEHIKEQNGSLYCIYPNKRVEKFLGGVFTSNGLAFNKLGTKMYFADTGRDVQTIWHFDYNLKEGIPMNKKVFTKTFDLKGRPDGAMVDIEDFYWVAGVEGSELYRYNTKGNIEDIIKLPVQKPTKPVFGGLNLDKIYLTSIGRGFDNSNNEINGLTLEISNHKYKGFPYKEFDY
tara:strand:- start:760 stop:1635 length:876 start_codon:yes stop_codon:yes gene_type:complete